MSEQASTEQVWNVVVPVIALVRAPSGTEAADRLARALTAAGFDVYEDLGAESVNVVPIEAEVGVGESSLPS